jgi:hypothetical protein
VVAQLRDVLAAVQSAEVAQEDEDDGSLLPERPDAPRRTRCIREFEIS